MEIKSGDIILVKGQSISAAFIRWFTKSEYTHVGIAIDENLIFEVDMFKKLGLYPNTHKEFDVYRYSKGLNRKQLKRMKKYAIAKAKTHIGYDWLKILHFAIKRFFPSFPEFLEMHQHEICSEIVDLVYHAVGVDLVPENRKGFISPADIVNSKVLKKVGSVQRSA